MDIEKYFSDYEAFPETIISDITAQGITLNNGICIDFNECAKVYAEINPGKDLRCVGEHEAADLSFTFYTLPKAVMIKFITKDAITNLCGFRDLQKRLGDYGCTTCDVS